MGAFYEYLLASLPTLRFGVKAPLAWEGFLWRAAGFIPASDLALLQNLPIPGTSDVAAGAGALIGRIDAFERALRNELVKLRAVRRKADASRFLRPDGYDGWSLAHIAAAAQRAASPLAAEQILDEARWTALDEYACGRYFDRDALIVYAYKLRILEKWDRIRAADAGRLLDEAALAAESGRER